MEVTVEHVAALNEEALLKVDYAAALEKFRRVSRLKKELERRPPIRKTPKTAPGGAHAVGAGGAAAAPAREMKYVPAAATAQALAVEEAKLRRVEESIRVFVRVADPKFRQIVPMRFFNLMLSPSEVEAYTADYLEQTNPRADAARMTLRMVAVTARLTTEIEELKRAPRGSTVWKLHMDSLAVLLDLARTLSEAIDRLVVKTTSASEAADGGFVMPDSAEKLKERTAEAGKILAAEA
jgi:hypothetical protein